VQDTKTNVESWPYGAAVDPKAQPLVPVLDGEASPERTGMSRPGKVGVGVAVVGVGVLGMAGLALYGLSRMARNLSWEWLQRTDIIIDDDNSDGADGKDGRDGKDGKPARSGTRKRAVGKPPNVSGDREGYNAVRFKSSAPVRLTMKALGYKVPFNDDPLVSKTASSNPLVSKFQRDWNSVIRGLDSGKVKLTGLSDPPKAKLFRGLLDIDGVPGKNTLNALEIGFKNWMINKLKWLALVEQAR